MNRKKISPQVKFYFALFLISLLLAALSGCQKGKSDGKDVSAQFSAAGDAQSQQAVTSGQLPHLEIYFTDPGTKKGEGVDPELDDALVNLINSAEDEILACLYEFNRQIVIDAMLGALNRGVTVKMVGDGDEIHDLGYEELIKAGIKISMRRPRDRIMHNKFVVVDLRYLWTGSTNITNNGIMMNNNNAILIDSPEIANIFALEFDEMYSKKRFGRKKVDVTPVQSVTFDNSEVEIHFSPKDGALNSIVQKVNNAKNEIYFMVFSFTHKDLREALLNAHHRGVKVVGIFDKSQARSRYSADDHLAKAGLPIYIDGNENIRGFAGGKLHHKVMIIDPVSKNGGVVTGSYNWSKSATRYNDENFIFLRQPSLITLYKQEFCKIFKVANPHSKYAGPAPEPCKDRPGIVVMNEIMSNPVGDERLNEYVELVNISEVLVDISGWKIGDARNDSRHIFSNLLLNPGEAVVIFGTYDTNKSLENAISSSSGSLSLNNYREVVSLYNAEGKEMDRFQYGSTKEGISFNRSPEGEIEAAWEYHHKITGAAGNNSPGLRFDGTPWKVTTPATAQLIINELLPNPVGTDRPAEFIEIVNIGTAKADLVGWTISDVSSKRHTFGGTILWPGQAIVVYGKTPPAGINNAIASSTGYLSLNNSGETITLKNAGGEVKDTVTYSKSKEGISLNREKDGKAGTILVNHNTISQHPMSPGQKTDLSQW